MGRTDITRLRDLRGKAMRLKKWSAFDNADFLGLNDPRMGPSCWNCEGCPSWDDINGCWRSHSSIALCGELGEDGLYDSIEDDAVEW